MHVCFLDPLEDRIKEFPGQYLAEHQISYANGQPADVPSDTEVLITWSGLRRSCAGRAAARSAAGPADRLLPRRRRSPGGGRPGRRGGGLAARRPQSGRHAHADVHGRAQPPAAARPRADHRGRQRERDGAGVRGPAPAGDELAEGRQRRHAGQQDARDRRVRRGRRLPGAPGRPARHGDPLLQADPPLAGAGGVLRRRVRAARRSAAPVGLRGDVRAVLARERADASGRANSG